MKYFKYLVLLLFISSCAPINVNYDYERKTDFAKYKTYNYYSDIETGLSPLDSKRLLQVLDEVLQAQGYQLSEDPDFFINITSAQFEEQQRSSVGVGLGGGGRNVGGGISVGIPVGRTQINQRIVFDFHDEKGIGLIWQAVSEASFNEKATPEQREARLKAIVTKVLKGFPPKTK